MKFYDNRFGFFICVQRATRDLKALNIPAQSCREEYLTMLAKWASTPEREKAASHLPLELLEADIEGLSDDEAEIAEREHTRWFRNFYRNSFADRSPLHRTYIRREVRAEWMLFVSIFALVHPEKAKAWFDPEREVQMRRETTGRTLRAHGRRPRSRQARTVHALRPTSAPQTVTHPNSAMED